MGIATRLADLAGAAMLTTTEVVDVERLDEMFLLVTVASPAFGSANWTPGSKVQIRPRRGTLAFRTYTPINWDPEQSRMSLLAYTHGDGPGAGWFRNVTPGMPLELFGPRRSLAPPSADEQVVFVGDETSIALACALSTTGASIAHVVETRHPDLLLGVLDRVGLSADIVATDPDRAALLDHVRRLAAGTPGPYRLVVTGDAATVHAVRRDARGWTVPPHAVTGKAYWAAGRTGLD